MAAIVLEGDGFAERALAEVPSGVDGVVDLIGARAVLDSLAVVRDGGTVCNSGLLGGEWVIAEFEPVADIPSGRKLTSYQSSVAADARVGAPALRAIVAEVERGAVDPGHRHGLRARRDRRGPPPHGGGRGDREARRASRGPGPAA